MSDQNSGNAAFTPSFGFGEQMANADPNQFPNWYNGNCMVSSRAPYHGDGVQSRRNAGGGAIAEKGERLAA